ncbi:MAG: thioredoxin domain-containing protein [Actinobacteria bacterium]|nr:thioredoxin domain-containing protein [Actinomycetota bacterium]
MPNRLAEETSPYLRQHAENPVDWYPWGQEALTRARDEGKPILLSVGYASCHWCHVMAHESFEDDETAAYMNEHFVNVKVDREERPDIDAIYIEAAQAISGHAGWPLTAFLTPSQAPFFVGTYFPPQPRGEMPSFRMLMEGVTKAWTEQRDEIEAGRERIVKVLSATAQLTPGEGDLSPAALDHALLGLAETYDTRLGGFGGAPKFPPHSVIDFLLAQAEEGYREIALDTLRAMAAGGIHDQLGGGFSRYSVDDRWHIPHFEKMLYDNALLARNYLHAFQCSGDEALAEVCRSTLDWMLVEMLPEQHGPSGGFAAALDADSLDASGHSEEGAFYAWPKDEFVEVVGGAAPGHVDDLLSYWGVIDDGEFEGANVLFVAAPEKRPPADVLAAARKALYDHRAERHWPERDDKRIASWNALAIAALAEAGAVLSEPRYLDAAIECAEFIERELRDGDGRLRRSWLDGRQGPPAYLEDYAYVAAAYLTLYEHCFDERWFVLARETAAQMVKYFADPEGGFFTTAGDHEELLVRRKDVDDNPIPSGNAAAAYALLRLSALTGDDNYRKIAVETLRILQPIAARHPQGFGHSLQAIGFALADVTEVALVGDDLSTFTSVLRSDFQPHRVVAGGAGDGGEVPLLRERPTVDGTSAAYVCRNFACQAPVTSSEALTALLST